jgi:uncharacterized membrane protein YfhO
MYSGILGVILLPAFFMSAKIRLREKISYGAVLVFLLISANVRILYFIMHGFIFPAGLPGRFSFLISFVIIIMAYRAYSLGLEKRDLISMAVIAIAIHVSAFFGTQENVLLSSVVTVIFLCVFALMLFCKREDFFALSKILVAVLIFAELTIAASTTVVFNLNNLTSVSRATYPTMHNEIAEMLDARQLSANSFVRTGMHPPIHANDNAIYGFDGVSNYSSLVSTDVRKFMFSIGLRGNISEHRFTYLDSLVTNAFLNIKYVINRTGEYDERFFDLIAYTDEILLLRNNRYLPLGFMVNSETANLTQDLINPLITQNDLFKLATGIEGYLFEAVPWNSTEHEEEEEYCSVSFTLEMPRDGTLHIFLSTQDDTFRNIQIVNVFVNDQRREGFFSMRAPEYARIADISQGETVTVHAFLDLGYGETMTAEAHIFNYDVFEEGFERLSREPLELTYFSDALIRGRITVLEDGLLYASIPHVGRWRAFVNGEERDIISIGGTMLGVSLEEGEHEIELRYHNPHLTMGAVISIFSLIIILALVIADKKFNKIHGKEN